MSEATQEQANRLLGMIADSVEQGREFVIEQAPDVAQQIVAYGRSWHTLAAIVGVAMILVATAKFRSTCNPMFAKAWTDPLSDGVDTLFVRGLLLGLLFFVIGGSGAIFVCDNARPAILAWFAPKLYIIEYCLRISK